MPLVLIISHVKNVKIISRMPGRANATLLINQNITTCQKKNEPLQLTKSLINVPEKQPWCQQQLRREQP